jgi:hypothetical protein
MTDDDPCTLRARADGLRRLAAALDASCLREVRARGGDATWRGPTPEAFQDECALAVRQLDAAVDELWQGARLLDRQADDASLATRP